MFRQMRRKKQALSVEQTIAILEEGTSGVLALAGDDDYPYAVPISYVYDGEKIYFHCAKSGHKLDAIARNEKASLCVVAQDHIVPEQFTTYFRSAIVFGRMRVLEDEGEKRSAIEKLAVKYSPHESPERREQEIDGSMSRLCMLEMRIEHMTGKESIELVNMRQEDRP